MPETFTCVVCGASGAGTLSKHMQTHTEKPHQCTQCNKRFTQIGSLNRHLRSHLVRDLINAMNVARPLNDQAFSPNTRKFTLVRNLINAMNVARPLNDQAFSPNTRKFTLVRNLINAMNVARPLNKVTL